MAVFCVVVLVSGDGGVENLFCLVVVGSRPHGDVVTTTDYHDGFDVGGDYGDDYGGGEGKDSVMAFHPPLFYDHLPVFVAV